MFHSRLAVYVPWITQPPSRFAKTPPNHQLSRFSTSGATLLRTHYIKTERRRCCSNHLLQHDACSSVNRANPEAWLAVLIIRLTFSQIWTVLINVCIIRETHSSIKMHLINHSIIALPFICVNCSETLSLQSTFHGRYPPLFWPLSAFVLALWRREEDCSYRWQKLQLQLPHK